MSDREFDSGGYAGLPPAQRKVETVCRYLVIRGVRELESRRFFGGGHTYCLIGRHPLAANQPQILHLPLGRGEGESRVLANLLR